MNEVGPPVDTLTEPHEPVVRSRPSVRHWIALLAGPTIWFAHFMVVYLAAETVCTPPRVGGAQPWSDRTLVGFIVGATGVAMIACGGAAMASWKFRRSIASLWHVGVVLALGSAASVLAVGSAVTLLEPC